MRILFSKVNGLDRRETQVMQRLLGTFQRGFHRVERQRRFPRAGFGRPAQRGERNFIEYAGLGFGAADHRLVGVADDFKCFFQCPAGAGGIVQPGRGADFASGRQWNEFKAGQMLAAILEGFTPGIGQNAGEELARVEIGGGQAEEIVERVLAALGDFLGGQKHRALPVKVECHSLAL